MSIIAGLFGLLVLAFYIFCVIAWVRGIIMVFSASVLLGIVCLFLQAPFPVFAIAYWITGVDLAERIVRALPEIFG